MVVGASHTSQHVISRAQQLLTWRNVIVFANITKFGMGKDLHDTWSWYPTMNEIMEIRRVVHPSWIRTKIRLTTSCEQKIPGWTKDDSPLLQFGDADQGDLSAGVRSTFWPFPIDLSQCPRCVFGAGDPL